MKRREFLSALGAGSTGAGLLSAAGKNSAGQQNVDESAYNRQQTTGVEPETATPYEHEDDPDRYELALHLREPDGDRVNVEEVCIEYLESGQTTGTQTTEQPPYQDCLGSERPSSSENPVADFYFPEREPGMYNVTVYHDDDERSSFIVELDDDSAFDVLYQPDGTVQPVERMETTTTGVTPTETIED